MKKFFKILLSFCAPIIVVLITIEVVVHSVPNSYSYKYQYVKENGNKIEALALGHSQIYDDFMPEEFALPSFNLANSAQPYREDWYVLHELLPYMKNLKLVILPIGYVTVAPEGYVDEEETRHRQMYYHEYMNVGYDGNIPLKYRREFLQPSMAIEKIVDYYVHHVDIVGCDSLGRRNTHYLKNRTQPLGTVHAIDTYTIEEGLELCIRYEEYLNKIQDMLKSRDIELVLVSPPQNWDYCMNLNEEQLTFVRDFAKKYSESHNLKYVDLSNCADFQDEDYFDESHLTELGAKKFTRMLNDSIGI